MKGIEFRISSINIPLFVSNTQVHLIDMVVSSTARTISVSSRKKNGRYPDVDEGSKVMALPVKYRC